MSASTILPAWPRQIALVLAVLVLAALAASGILWPNPRPAAANPLAGIADVTAGEWHTCALTTTGGVLCWGDNGFGQLGNGSTGGSAIPVGVSGLASGVTAVSAGGLFNCAVTSAGGAKCWGSGFGATPVDVVGLASGVASIDGGGQHTCAVTTGGGLKCWGQNGFGQLGDGTTTKTVTPVDVSGLASGVVSVSPGIEHTCALMVSGGVKCWGFNDFGQLGDGTTAGSTVPVDVVGLASGITAIAAGGNYSCALTSTGGIKCWGLGFGTNPVDVVGLNSDVAAISASLYHFCALTTAGGLKCRGQNAFGQLGDGTTTKTVTPVDVVGFASGASAVATGYHHTCAVTTAGGAKCWGSNYDGQLGNGRTSGFDANPIPVDVVELTAKPTATSTPCGPQGCPTPTETPTPPPQTGLDFSLGIDADGDTEDDCATDAEGQTKCSVLADGAFTVNVYLRSLPVNVAGYDAFDIRLDYAGVVSKEIAGPGPWPDCAFPAVAFRPDFVAFGCITGIRASPSTYVGLIGTAEFTCSEPGTVTMVHGPTDTELLVPPGYSISEGEGVTETLTINCVEPTPTPTVPPVGGVGAFPDATTGDAGGVAMALAASAAAAIALGGAAWYARRRLRTE